MDSYNYFITIDEDNELQVYKDINEQTPLMNILEQEEEEESSWDSDDNGIEDWWNPGITVQLGTVAISGADRVSWGKSVPQGKQVQ